MVEKPSLEQSYDQDLQAEKVATMANLVAREMHTQTIEKKHGSYLIYDDDRLVITLDAFRPHISISIIREEQHINVFSAGLRIWEKPGVFHRGRWMDYLEKLSEKAETIVLERKEKERIRSQMEQEARFNPVDDLDLFPQEKDES